jgi:hypothetical protein
MGSVIFVPKGAGSLGLTRKNADIYSRSLYRVLTAVVDATLFTKIRPVVARPNFSSRVAHWCVQRRSVQGGGFGLSLV